MLMADITWVLWEVFGTPIEGYADGTEAKLEVHYDESDKVKSVKVLSGADVLGITDNKEKKPEASGE